MKYLGIDLLQPIGKNIFSTKNNYYDTVGSTKSQRMYLIATSKQRRIKISKSVLAVSRNRNGQNGENEKSLFSKLSKVFDKITFRAKSCLLSS